MILGIGTDLININRIATLVKKFPLTAVNKILSELEILDYNKIPQPHGKIAYIAKRFSAKEALAKAVGCGIYHIGFKNIHILNNNLGKPYISLDFDLHKYFNIPKTIKIYHDISLSDEKDYAVTLALIWR